MKTFKQYLTESTKEHKFTLRFCCDLDEVEENRIETFLSKYDLKTMSKTSTTPITKNPMFFNNVTNSKVSKIDIVTGYPLSADILQQQLSDLLSVSLENVVIHPEGWEPEVEEDSDEDIICPNHIELEETYDFIEECDPMFIIVDNSSHTCYGEPFAEAIQNKFKNKTVIAKPMKNNS